MSFVTTGLVVSVLSTLILSTLFSYEKKRGARFFSRARAYADVVVLRCADIIRRVLRFVGRDFMRQMFHYVFHKLLRVTLALIRKCEEWLGNAIRVNKSLAKSVEEESETRTMLGEVALHKAANTLTEEEKRRHKDKMLQGL